MQFLILLSSLNEEDRTFIEALYYRYGDFMYKTALDILHDSHDAEDAVMDVMCKIIKYAAKFDGASDTQIQNQIVIGIRTTVKRKAIDCYNARKKVKQNELYLYELEESNFEIEDMDGDPGELLLAKESRLAVQKALTLLPKAQQDAINLVYYGGYSTVEAADFLNITVEALRGRLHKARNNLKKLLRSEFCDL